MPATRISHHAGARFAGPSREFMALPTLYRADPIPLGVKLRWAAIGAVAALILTLVF